MSEYDQFNFFSAIFKYVDEGQVEIRQLPSKKQSFHDIKDVALLALTDSEHVYFTPATRNGGGRKEHIAQIPCLWTDIDFKNTPEGNAKKLISEYPLPPTAIVNSGGGLHLWWSLKEPLEKSDIPEVESYLKRLADYFGGDRGVTDASHVMRVPSTLNHKYNPPRNVTLQNLTRSNEYELSDFDQYLPDLEQVEKTVTVKPDSGEIDINSLPISASIKALIRNGVPEGQRSEIIASVLSTLLRAKVSDQTIFQIFNKYPIGEKYREKGHGKDKWLADEIVRARGFADKKHHKKRPTGVNLAMAKEKFQHDKEIKFVWRGVFPAGMPSMLAGREGSGKTTNAMQMAKEIIESHDTGYVGWLGTEGAFLDTIDKADKLGLDNPRFVFAEKSDGTYKFEFSRYDDRKELDILLTELDGPILAVFIDSIRGMAKYGDSDDENGRIMHVLNSIVCDKHRGALIYLDHHKKGAASNLLDKTSGSTSKTSAVRLVMAIEQKSKLVRTIKPAKVNIFKQIPELESIMVGNEIHIRELTKLSDESLKDKAQLWLTELMAENKEMYASDAYRRAEEKGFSDSILKRAKLDLPITSKRIENRWKWIWDL